MIPDDLPSLEELYNARGFEELYDSLYLRMEIVPQTCWYFNLRKLFTVTKWGEVRNIAYAEYFYTCPFCKEKFWDTSYNEFTDEIKNPTGGGLHAHEIWVYDDDNHVQSLEGIVALCPTCHNIKHMFRTLKMVEEGNEHIHYDDIVKQFCEVNSISPDEYEKILEFEMTLFYERSKHEWVCDIGSYLSYVKNTCLHFIAEEKLIGDIESLDVKQLRKIQEML